jgi:RNA polymerase sigma-70 factor, ECF subfamily
MEETVDIQDDYNFRVTIPIGSGGNLGKHFRETATPKEQQLVLAARSGCQIAFRELWELYWRRVYRTLLTIMKNADDAEDALQDAFFRAFLALESFEGRSSFYSWLTRIAINSGLAILRRRRSRPEGALNLDIQSENEDGLKEFRDLAPDPEQIYAKQEKLEKLLHAIQNLSPELRVAIRMRLSDNCSVKDIAARLSISEAAAKSRLYRARTTLSSLTVSRCKAKENHAISGLV